MSLVPPPWFRENLQNFKQLPVAERIGVVGLYWFILFAWMSNIKALEGVIVLVFGCLIDRRFWAAIRYSRIAHLTIVLAAYILIRALLAINENPDYARFHIEDGGRLMLLALFICIGWLLQGKIQRVYWLLGIGLIGFWLGRMEHMSFVDMFTDPTWWKTRHDFELPSAIAFGQYAAASLAGLLIMLPHLWKLGSTAWKKGLIMTAWTWFTFLSVQGIIVSQTRAVWLSLIVVFFMLIIAKLALFRRLGLMKSLVVVVLVGGILATTGYLNRSVLQSRFSAEIDTTTAIFSGEFDKIKAKNKKGHVKSIGIRYHMLLFGVEHWLDNPLFGLGPGITEPLIRDQWKVSRTYSHLHDSYVEILLRLGLVGTGLILVILIMLLQDAKRARSQGRLDSDLFHLLVIALTLHLLVSFTNFRMLNGDWRYYWSLFGGILFTFSMFPRRPAEIRKTGITRPDPAAGHLPSD